MNVSQHFGLSRWLHMAMILMFSVVIFERSFVVAAGIFVNIVLAFLPSIIHKSTKKNLPWTLDLSVTLALFLHTTGITFDLYHDPQWWWWDELTHFLGSFIVGMIAFHLVFTMNFLGKVKMSIPMVGLFLFLTAMGIGGIWEIAESYSDMFLGTNTQISLQETIRDLQFDFLGAALISFVAMRYFFLNRSKNSKTV